MGHTHAQVIPEFTEYLFSKPLRHQQLIRSCNHFNLSKIDIFFSVCPIHAQDKHKLMTTSRDLEYQRPPLWQTIRVQKAKSDYKTQFMNHHQFIINSSSSHLAFIPHNHLNLRTSIIYICNITGVTPKRESIGKTSS